MSFIRVSRVHHCIVLSRQDNNYVLIIACSTETPPVRTHQESGPVRTSGPIRTHDPWGRDGAKGGREGGGGYRDMDFRESSSAGGDKHGVDPWQRGSGDRDRDYRNRYVYHSHVRARILVSIKPHWTALF